MLFLSFFFHTKFVKIKNVSRKNKSPKQESHDETICYFFFYEFLLLLFNKFDMNYFSYKHFKLYHLRSVKRNTWIYNKHNWKLPWAEFKTPLNAIFYFLCSVGFCLSSFFVLHVLIFIFFLLLVPGFPFLFRSIYLNILNFLKGLPLCCVY